MQGVGHSALSMAAIGLAAGFADTAAADVFEVTRRGDPPPGPCLGNDCSLREGSGNLLGGRARREVEPQLPFPPDGCAIAVRSPLRIDTAWRLAPEFFAPAVVCTDIKEDTPAGHEVMPERLACRYSARALFAEVSDEESRFVVSALHATRVLAESADARSMSGSRSSTAQSRWRSRVWSSPSSSRLMRKQAPVGDRLTG